MCVRTCMCARANISPINTGLNLMKLRMDITVHNGQPRWLSGLRRIRVHSLWLLVDHCVLRIWDRILVRAVKGLISRAGMVSICPLLWQRDVKLQQTNSNKQTSPKGAKVYPASRRRSNKRVGLKGQLAPHCVLWLKNSIMAYKRLSTSLGSKTLNNTSSSGLGGTKI